MISLTSKRFIFMLYQRDLGIYRMTTITCLLEKLVIRKEPVLFNSYAEPLKATIFAKRYSMIEQLYL